MMIKKESLYMKGSIRACVGLLVVFCAVGGMDNATDSQLYTVLLPIAALGLGIMYSGVSAMSMRGSV
jgi:hypothetical protein